MHIRQARPEDLPAIAALEARGFPPAEAASPESFAARLPSFPTVFSWPRMTAPSWAISTAA